MPPEFELYDLESDPYEFRSLAEDKEYADVKAKLTKLLMDWRRDTNDPLLDADKLAELNSEIEACFAEGVPNKNVWS